jgi:hypothetical protein
MLFLPKSKLMVIGGGKQILLTPAMTVRPDLFDLFDATYTALSGWRSKSWAGSYGWSQGGELRDSRCPGLVRIRGLQ